VVLIFPFLPQFSEFVADMGGSGGSIVANAHMIFNVVAALVFILISNQVAALIERAVPGKEHEIVFRTRYLDKVPKATDAAIKAAVMESEHQLEIVKEMFDTSTDMLVRHDARGMSRVEKLKALNDFLDRKVSSLLAEVSLRKLSNGQSSEIIMVSRISYELKKLGNAGYDYAALAARLDEKNIRLSAESCRDLASIKEGFDSILALLARNIRRMDRDKVAEMDAMRREIDAAISMAHRHRIELISSATAGTEAVLVFLDAITALDHSNSALIRIGRLLASRKPR